MDGCIALSMFSSFFFFFIVCTHPAACFVLLFLLLLVYQLSGPGNDSEEEERKPFLLRFQARPDSRPICPSLEFVFFFQIHAFGPHRS